MKKILFFLSIVCLMACYDGSNQKSSAESDSSAVIIEEECDCDSVVYIDEDIITETSEDSEVTLDFSSYHLYTCEDDKYDSDGYQPVSAKVIVNEDAQKVTLKLYDSGEYKWFVFNFRIDEKLHLQEGVIAYTVYNNVNQKGYIYISTNRANGLFIDINNFVYDGDVICCWMQEGGSSGSEYRQETVTIERTPNTYSSGSSYSPTLSSGSLHSDERITGSYSNYSNYEETDNCVEGVVVYEGDDDYYIVQTRRGFTVLERRSGSLWEGHKVRGELNRYGTKYLINRNRDSEVRVYIEEYMLTEDDAIEWLGEHDHLDDDDQEIYDANNQ